MTTVNKAIRKTRYRYFTLGVMLFPFFLFSCFSSDNKKEPAPKLEKTVHDTLIKDIPLTAKGKPSDTYLAKQIFAKALKLDVLEEGFDSIQIRLWAAYTFTDTIQIIVLKKQQQRWIGEFATVRYKDDARTDGVEILSKELEYKDPKSGWDRFIGKLFKAKILTLPDVHQIANYPSLIHADNFSVEFATTNNYRFYEYPAPHSAMAEVWQAKSMEEILQLIEEEFSFKRLRSLAD